MKISPVNSQNFKALYISEQHLHNFISEDINKIDKLSATADFLKDTKNFHLLLHDMFDSYIVGPNGIFMDSPTLLDVKCQKDNILSIQTKWRGKYNKGSSVTINTRFPQKGAAEKVLQYLMNPTFSMPFGFQAGIVKFIDNYVNAETLSRTLLPYNTPLEAYNESMRNLKDVIMKRIKFVKFVK